MPIIGTSCRVRWAMRCRRSFFSTCVPRSRRRFPRSWTSRFGLWPFGVIEARFAIRRGWVIGSCRDIAHSFRLVRRVSNGGHALEFERSRHASLRKAQMLQVCVSSGSLAHWRSPFQFEQMTRWTPCSNWTCRCSITPWRTSMIPSKLLSAWRGKILASGRSEQYPRRIGATRCGPSSMQDGMTGRAL